MPTPDSTFELPAEPLNEKELDIYRDQLIAFKAELDEYKAKLDSHESSRERIFEQRKSAEEEYDKMIVYLAGGGLVLTVGFVKDLTKAAETQQIGWLLGCWISFAAALLVNLVSHALARLSADAFLTDHPKYKKYDGWVRAANLIALILVGCGVTAFLIFVYQNFPAHGQASIR